MVTLILLPVIGLPYVKTSYSQKLYLDGVLRRHSIGIAEFLQSWLLSLTLFPPIFLEIPRLDHLPFRTSMKLPPLHQK